MSSIFRLKVSERDELDHHLNMLFDSLLKDDESAQNDVVGMFDLNNDIIVKLVVLPAQVDQKTGVGEAHFVIEHTLRQRLMDHLIVLRDPNNLATAAAKLEFLRANRQLKSALKELESTCHSNYLLTNGVVSAVMVDPTVDNTTRDEQLVEHDVSWDNADSSFMPFVNSTTNQIEPEFGYFSQDDQLNTRSTTGALTTDQLHPFQATSDCSSPANDRFNSADPYEFNDSLTGLSQLDHYRSRSATYPPQSTAQAANSDQSTNANEADRRTPRNDDQRPLESVFVHESPAQNGQIMRVLMIRQANPSLSFNFELNDIENDFKAVPERHYQPVAIRFDWTPNILFKISHRIFANDGLKRNLHCYCNVAKFECATFFWFKLIPIGQPNELIKKKEFFYTFKSIRMNKNGNVVFLYRKLLERHREAYINQDGQIQIQFYLEIINLKI